MILTYFSLESNEQVTSATQFDCYWAIRDCSTWNNYRLQGKLFNIFVSYCSTWNIAYFTSKGAQIVPNTSPQVTRKSLELVANASLFSLVYGNQNELFHVEQCAHYKKALPIIPHLKLKKHNWLIKKAENCRST
jgi:hypothetical protein